MRSPRFLFLLPTVLATYVPFCAQPVRPTVTPDAAPMSAIWRDPQNIASRDLFNGPWGAARAPSPADTYTLVEHKHTGVNPGMTVRDSQGRRWSVKRAAPDTLGPEGPIEVVLSRTLSAAGYHQPPVYHLPTFTLRDDWGARRVSGGRFRLHDKKLKDRGSWSWQQNPYVGTRPYQGLLVILMMFNSSDLKNANNTLYEYRGQDGPEQWYVVRDLGTALGQTGRLAPLRGDPVAFERSVFIEGVTGGFVRFGYRGWHQELVTGRIRPDDVAWAARLLGGLTEEQWRDAFRAGGYPDEIARKYMQSLWSRIAQGQGLANERSRTGDRLHVVRP